MTPTGTWPSTLTIQSCHYFEAHHFHIPKHQDISLYFVYSSLSQLAQLKGHLLSGLKQLKTALHSSMTTHKLTGLALLTVYHGIHIDIPAAIDNFPRHHPRRLQMIKLLGRQLNLHEVSHHSLFQLKNVFGTDSLVWLFVYTVCIKMQHLKVGSAKIARILGTQILDMTLLYHHLHQCQLH